jgi:hypothetical protein
MPKINTRLVYYSRFHPVDADRVEGKQHFVSFPRDFGINIPSFSIFPRCLFRPPSAGISNNAHSTENNVPPFIFCVFGLAGTGHFSKLLFPEHLLDECILVSPASTRRSNDQPETPAVLRRQRSRASSPAGDVTFYSAAAADCLPSDGVTR